MPITEQHRENLKRIASRLLLIESQNPGTIRIQANPNPSLLSAMAADFRNLGCNKPLFQSAQQFIFDSVVSNQAALEMALNYTMLAGPIREAKIPCWNGWGVYVGWQGILQLSDFSDGKGERLLMVMVIDACFNRISDLLDPVPERR